MYHERVPALMIVIAKSLLPCIPKMRVDKEFDITGVAPFYF
jgi:hypothetical protein